jgi:hypothetical protein
MLPDFDDAGNLPPGIHDASLAEVERRFATNDVRKAIFQDLENWIAHMAQAGCRCVYINGSFVTAKDQPADYDACWDATGVDFTRLDACLSALNDEDLVASKARFGGDIRIDYASPDGSIARYIDIFQRDGRNGNRPKGIVRLQLSP